MSRTRSPRGWSGSARCRNEHFGGATAVSILIVGVSHRTAAVELLEALALDRAAAAKLRAATVATPAVNEAVVLATCNRTEVYAAVDRFHASVDDLTRLLLDHAGDAAEQLLPAMYVLYDAAAVAHHFSVVAGLDSMVVGEPQILGQAREALRDAQADETVGTTLNALFQQGLRVGKRAHAETGIDRAGQSMVSVALDEACESLGTLRGRLVCIVGAGSIASLAAATVARAGGQVVVMSRTRAKAARIAEQMHGRALSLTELPHQLQVADLVICCTGATGVIVTAGAVRDAVAARSGRPLVLIDLALPHDVDDEVQQIAGVVVVGLRDLATSVHNPSPVTVGGEDHTIGPDVEAVRGIVAEEVAAFAAARSAAQVAPTVVALRSMATAVVAGELDRLWSRLDVSARQREEISRTVRRVADKLLHEPTVRIKEFADRTPDSTYAEALAELFALDPTAVDALTQPGGRNKPGEPS